VTVHIGIAGWSYADWKGKVYPASCRDPLGFCARYVDLLEVNSTFYRIPGPATTAAWAERTRDHGTLFTVKVARSFTHERQLDPLAIAEFCAAVQPLHDAGRLRALLLQFPFTFVDRDKNRAHLARLVEVFAASAPLAVEVRHASWQSDAALDFLRGLAVSLVHLDHPAGAESFDLPLTGVQAHGLAYFRLHGRNQAAWWRKGAGRDEVYDWTYARSEVGDVAQRLRAIAADAATTLVVANNHFEGKAMKLALELVARHRGGKVEVPELLRATYPELAEIAARSGQGWLFR
jgi:uncharacterized protein YecE (DUF72 family)